MSLEKLAKVLHVDEVQLMHGPLGVAVHIRLGKSWCSSTIDNEVLGESRLEVIAEHLAQLADLSNPKAAGALRKSHAEADGATRAALQADRDAELRRGSGWGNDWFDRPYDGPLRQVQRAVEPAPAARPAESPPESAVTAPMPSRFHAIMAELRDL